MQQKAYLRKGRLSLANVQSGPLTGLHVGQFSPLFFILT